MACTLYLILRSARRARLEGRTLPISRMVDLSKRAPSRLHSTFLEKSLTSPSATHYDIPRKVAEMNGTQAVHALGALAHETRLAIYRMLVERGPDGLSAGIIAERLGLPPSSLTFHVQHLHRAGLVTQRRLSRQLIYAADFAAMNGLVGFLTENCCGRAARLLAGPAVPPAPQTRERPHHDSSLACPSPSSAPARSGWPRPRICWRAARRRSCWKPAPRPGTPSGNGAMCACSRPGASASIAQAAALLATRGWSHPPADDVPTGAELVARYLEPLAAAPRALSPAQCARHRRDPQHADKVRTAGREALPFVLRVAAPDGAMRSVEARAVIDASGTWSTPNPAGADGLPAIGEDGSGGPDRYRHPRCAGRRPRALCRPDRRPWSAAAIRRSTR